MGFVKTRRLAAMRPPSPSAFAKATADERRTGKHPPTQKLLPSPRLLRTSRRTWQRGKAEGIPGDLGCYVDILMAGEVDA